MSEGVTIQTNELDIDKRSKCEIESDAFLNQASLIEKQPAGLIMR